MFFSRRIRVLASVTALTLLTGALVVSAQRPPTSGAGGTRVDTLRINGSVGYRQFLRVTMWISGNLIKQPGAPRIWLSYHETAAGFRDSLLELANRRAEMTLVNARSVANMAQLGRGMFPQAMTNLRAIASIPHYDWQLFAVDASLGVRSFSDILEKKVPLKLTTGKLDGDNAVGFVAMEILKRHGITLADLKSWGGGVLPSGLGNNRDDVLSGQANAVSQEGARGQEWEELFRKRPMTFISIEPEVADSMKRELGFTTLTVPANYYPGQDRPAVFADFSDWLVCVRADMDEGLAYELAKLIIEKREGLDKEYGAEKPRYSSVNVPTVPEKLANTDPVPLHPGAAKYYREKGLVK